MKYFSSLLFICLCLLLPAQASAQIPDFNQGDAFPQQEEPDFLPVDDAFVFDFQQNDDELTLNFTIADDYYLYKHQFKLVGKDVELGEPVFPEGKEKEDEFFGLTEVYYHNVSFTVPVNQAKEDGVVKVRFQGCADAGLCYPPTVKVIYLSAVGDTEPAVQDSAPSEATGEAVKSEQFGLAERLADKDNPHTVLWQILRRTARRAKTVTPPRGGNGDIRNRNGKMVDPANHVIAPQATPCRSSASSRMIWTCATGRRPNMLRATRRSAWPAISSTCESSRLAPRPMPARASSMARLAAAT